MKHKCRSTKRLTRLLVGLAAIQTIITVPRLFQAHLENRREKATRSNSWGMSKLERRRMGMVV